MERRSFFSSFFAALGAPLAFIFAPSKGFLESISKWPSDIPTTGSYRTYIMGDTAIFNKAELKGLFDTDPPFAKLAERRQIPVHTSVSRQFFTYGDAK